MAPTLSMFYGVIVRMYNESDGKHHVPHVHASYSGNNAVVDFDGNVLEGGLPSSKMKLLSAWIEMHRDELAANWQLLGDSEEFYKIEPLR